MLPIRNISYLLPMCCSFWEKCKNSLKTGLGCSTPLIHREGLNLSFCCCLVFICTCILFYFFGVILTKPHFFFCLFLFLFLFFSPSDSWRENPDFALYLAELSSYGVDKLGKNTLIKFWAQIPELTGNVVLENSNEQLQSFIVWFKDLLGGLCVYCFDLSHVLGNNCNQSFTEEYYILASFPPPPHRSHAPVP